MKSSPILHFGSRFNSTAMIMANHLFFLLLSLLAIAASAQVSVNIDCGGSSNGYTDKNGIKWSGDGPYIQTGQSKVVQTPNSVSQEMSTLRVFSSRNKNCYSINVTQVLVLVRASFYYGNYDLKSSPPTFDLQFNGNNWTTVVTSSDQVVFEEVIYGVTADAVNVCLAQTQANQLPFISALEVRILDSSMYNYIDSTINALFLADRLSYGANQATRYPQDQYDRIWTVVSIDNTVTVVTSNTPVAVNKTDCPDCPPSSVLQNAVTTSDASTPLQATFDLPTTDVPVYTNWYFSDIAYDSTLQRSFTINVDGLDVGPITPPSGTALGFCITNITASSTTPFTLQPTFNATAPPLLNALEVFVVSDPLTNGTNSDDVNALGLLKTQFVVLAGWSGDPCLPAPYTWDWVACNSDATPRLTALYLNGYGLSGTLPDFSSMVALQTIDLHNNSLTGEIPNSLGKLPSLTLLNLANNDLSGSVPTSLSSNKNLKLDVSGNQKLCISDSSSCRSSTPSSSGSSTPSSTTPSTSSGKSSSKLPIILGVTIPVVVLFLVIAAFVTFKIKRETVATSATMNAGGGPQQGQAMPQASNGQMPPAMNVQHEANDVKVELQHNIQDELSELMDQQAHQEHNWRSPAPLLHNQ